MKIDIAARFPKSVSDGKNKQDHFEKDIKARGYEVERSTEDEDKNDHIDMYFSKNGKRYSVDVKKTKAIENKYDVDDDFIVIEMKCVGGGKGWIESKADFIAFELDFQWLLVRTHKLKEYVVPRVLDKRIKRLSKSQLHKQYHRRMHWLAHSEGITINPEESDVVVLFTTEEIWPLLSWAFEKSQTS